VSVLFAEWWSSDSRSTPGFISNIDRLFHDAPQPKPAQTPAGTAALPTPAANQPASVGTTGGNGPNGGTGLTSPNNPVDPSTSVATSPSRRTGAVDQPRKTTDERTRKDERTPKDASRATTKREPCDARQASAQEETDVQQTLPNGASPCEDRTAEKPKQAGTPPAP
jgi:hypothetical protein